MRLGIWGWLWGWPLVMWLWYWDRWDECMQPTGPGDPPEVLERVALWLAYHMLVAVAGIWWAVEILMGATR